ncbi:MAG: segregation and condensation protein A [gamma proteobacterium symbiont of Phacoides pectinatus]
MSDSSKEREILMVMRKVLASVVKDTTPAPGTRHTLTERTIEDIRLCFGLIAARERELADAAGAVPERPYFADQQPAANVVPIDKIGRIKPQDPEE